MKYNLIKEAHGLYLCGMSIEQVAKRYDMTRQSLHAYFKRLNLSTRKVRRKPAIKVDGYNWTKDRDGYYRKTSGDRIHLHKYLWLKNGNVIPEGHALKFIDGNKENYNIENIKCMTVVEMSADQVNQQNQHTKGRK